MFKLAFRAAPWLFVAYLGYGHVAPYIPAPSRKFEVGHVCPECPWTEGCRGNCQDYDRVRKACPDCGHLGIDLGVVSRLRWIGLPVGLATRKEDK